MAGSVGIQEQPQVQQTFQVVVCDTMSEFFNPYSDTNRFNPSDLGAAQPPDFAGRTPNFSNGSNLNTLAGPPPVIQVENLSLADVMKNPIVQRMYNSWQEATDKVMQGVQIQQNLYKENSQLNAQVKELQSICRESM